MRASRLFIVDEAHTIRTWLILYGYIMLLFLSILRGQAFRKIMLRISEIRSLLPAEVPILALTATITKAGRVEVSKTLGLCNEAVITMSPSKSNIKFLKMPLKKALVK